jgi:hypothetical protein
MEAGNENNPRNWLGEKATGCQGAFVLPSNPIADLLPGNTIVVADIAGFMPRSCVRVPSQVLLSWKAFY